MLASCAGFAAAGTAHEPEGPATRAAHAASTSDTVPLLWKKRFGTWADLAGRKFLVVNASVTAVSSYEWSVPGEVLVNVVEVEGPVSPPPMKVTIRWDEQAQQLVSLAAGLPTPSFTTLQADGSYLTTTEGGPDLRSYMRPTGDGGYETTTEQQKNGQWTTLATATMRPLPAGTPAPGVVDGAAWGVLAQMVGSTWVQLDYDRKVSSEKRYQWDVPGVRMRVIDLRDPSTAQTYELQPDGQLLLARVVDGERRTRPIGVARDGAVIAKFNYEGTASQNRMWAPTRGCVLIESFRYEDGWVPEYTIPLQRQGGGSCAGVVAAGIVPEPDNVTSEERAAGRRDADARDSAEARRLAAEQGRAAEVAEQDARAEQQAAAYRAERERSEAELRTSLARLNATGEASHRAAQAELQGRAEAAPQANRAQSPNGTPATEPPAGRVASNARPSPTPPLGSSQSCRSVPKTGSYPGSPFMATRAEAESMARNPSMIIGCSRAAATLDRVYCKNAGDRWSCSSTWSCPGTKEVCTGPSGSTGSVQ